MLEGHSLQEPLEFEVVRESPTKTTLGETSIVTKNEVARLAHGGNVRVQR